MIPEVWQTRVRQSLEAHFSAGLQRSRRHAFDACGPLRRIEGRDFLTFASNDYLGLAADPRIKDALRNAVGHWGLGSGAAQLLGGYTAAHKGLEERLADWVGQPRALLFSTGYQANLAMLDALAGKGDLICEDRLNHASLIDAARISGATLRRYLHTDSDSLDRRLEKARADHALVATDSVFSMDGDLAPLTELATVARRHDALFLVDDAHALGVIGDQGCGAAASSGANPALVMATLGKALGSFGAFLAGNEDLIEWVAQTGRAHIYTTAPPPAVAAATLVAVELARQEDWRRQKLAELIHRLRSGAAKRGIELLPSDTPIQPLVLRSVERAASVSEGLAQQGIWVPAIRPPTVPADSCRLRITLTAAHEPAHVDRLLEALESIL
ncbi:MAG: 8-amino-7-oxononanoate synthase [Xanthomonadales bacterium]|nr:8-amino-7-oxononanoate synthase [Xanthomonadales bacterium]